LFELAAGKEGEGMSEAEKELRDAAQAALELIESSLSHVSHGGPTHEDAEKVRARLLAALQRERKP
jgi:hypothetical protein